MKRRSRYPFTGLSKEQVEDLTIIVRETLAADLLQPKTFSNADLWNIQRRRKAMQKRRHII